MSVRPVRLRRVAATCGVAVSGVGALAVVGWLSHATRLIRLAPDLGPMRFNTALCFVFVGLGGALAAYGRRRSAFVLGAVAGALGGLTALQYVFGVDFAVDQILTQDYVTPLATYPGRMALSAAVCFLLGGIGVVAGSRLVDWRHRELLAAISGSAAAAIGVAAVTGYFIDRSAAYAGSGPAAVALHTAAGFFLMGAALVVLAWSQSDLSQGELGPSWAPLPVGLAAVACVFALWRALSGQEDMFLRHAVDVAGDEVQDRLRDHITLYARAIDRMAQRESMRPTMQVDAWRRDAEIYARDFLGLWATVWVDLNGKVQVVSPLTGADFLVGMDLAAFPSIYAALDDARAHMTPTVAGPFELPTRRSSLVVCAPIVHEDEASGFIGAFVDPEAFLTQVGDEYIERNYGVEIRADSTVLHTYGEPPTAARARWRTQAAVESLGARFEVVIWPNARAVGEAKSAIPFVVLVIGLTAAGAAAIVTRLLLVTHRNAFELAEANVSLQDEVRARREAEAEARQSEERIRQMNDRLEERVRERTADLHTELDERTRVEDALRKSERERSQLIGELMTVQEDERARIARDLHDHAGQALTSLLVGLKALSGMDAVAEVRQRADELRELAVGTLEQVRTLSFDMYPSVLEHLGLVAALEQDAGRFEDRHGISVDIHAEGEPAACPHPVKAAVYRVVHAALTNIAQHSHAENVGIVMRSRADRLLVIVEDDGVGFDVDDVLSGPVEGRFGLMAMQERLRPVSGAVRFESTPGEGTSLFIEVDA